MHKHFLFIFTLLLFITFGCQKSTNPSEEDSSTIHFSVYGTVYDSYGEPVNGAKISLYDGFHFEGTGTCIGSCVSGLDGQYKIPCIVIHEQNVRYYDHNYQLEVHCSGYKDYFERLTIKETEGLEMRIDVALK